MIMAYSFTMQALIETTEAGELLTKTRESVIETYGDPNSKRASEIYSEVVNVVKQIRKNLGGNKLTDRFVFKTVGVLAAKTIGLQMKNEMLALAIKRLDAKVYYDRRIDPTQERPIPGGGGGASQSY